MAGSCATDAEAARSEDSFASDSEAVLDEADSEDAFAAALEDAFDADSEAAFFDDSFSEAVIETDFLEVEEETSAVVSLLSLGASTAPKISDTTEMAKRINGTLPVILLSRFFARLIPQMIKVTQKAIPVISQSIMKNVIPILLKAFNVIPVCTYVCHLKGGFFNLSQCLFLLSFQYTLLNRRCHARGKLEKSELHLVVKYKDLPWIHGTRGLTIIR